MARGYLGYRFYLCSFHHFLRLTTSLTSGSIHTSFSSDAISVAVMLPNNRWYALWYLSCTIEIFAQLLVPPLERGSLWCFSCATDYLLQNETVIAVGKVLHYCAVEAKHALPHYSPLKEQQARYLRTAHVGCLSHERNAIHDYSISPATITRAMWSLWPLRHIGLAVIYVAGGKEQSQSPYPAPHKI